MSAIIKKGLVRAVETPPERSAPRAAPPAGPARARHEKRVQLLELDGLVHAVELVCSCGEVSLIELEYPAAPAPATSLDER